MKAKDRQVDFMRALSKADVACFLGVMRILKVKPKEDFVDTFEEVLAQYAAAPKSRQKELLRILRAANQCAPIDLSNVPDLPSRAKEADNASNSEDTEATAEPVN